MKKVIKRKKCPKCSDGEMMGTGTVFSNSVGTYYEHSCTNCEHKEQYPGVNYPYEKIEFKPEEIETIWD